MSSSLFEPKDTKEIQHDVRTLFRAMSDDFRDHLMRSFLWSQEKFDDYLSRDVTLQGDMLREAYSHLESLLARIEGFADKKPHEEFMSYERWVDEEYLKYKTSLHEDVDDIERLMDEGGVVAPGKISPVDTMEDDSLSHYHQLKTEFDEARKRSHEAVKLMESTEYINLHKHANRMCKIIMHEIHK